MPVSITKTTVTPEHINAMVLKAFGCLPESFTELTEGYFNIAYRVGLKDRAVILKIAPPDDVDIMSYEKNIMFSEVDSMRMVKEKTGVPVPEILFYDDSCEICGRTYFFYGRITGTELFSCMEQMTEKEKDEIYYKVGQYTKELNRIYGSCFGYYAQPEKQGKNWYQVFQSMMESIYFDAERKNIAMPVSKEELFRLLKKDEPLFDMVTEPKFVHWDIWAGNVFVKDKKITGIIDFERCLWADELMEVGFRTYDIKQAFLSGYGLESLTKEQTRRAVWYDIYLLLTMRCECDYRMYDNRWAYEWSGEKTEYRVKLLKEGQ